MLQSSMKARYFVHIHQWRRYQRVGRRVWYVYTILDSYQRHSSTCSRQLMQSWRSRWSSIFRFALNLYGAFWTLLAVLISHLWLSLFTVLGAIFAYLFGLQKFVYHSHPGRWAKHQDSAFILLVIGGLGDQFWRCAKSGLPHVIARLYYRQRYLKEHMLALSIFTSCMFVRCTQLLLWFYLCQVARGSSPHLDILSF